MRADTVRKIVLVAVAVVLIAATLFALAACNPASTVQAPDGGGNTPPSAPENPETPETPETPDTPDTPENPETPEPEPEPEPELTEAEYYEKNIELLKAALKEEWEEDNPKRVLVLSQNEIVINASVGEIYFIADTEGGLGAVRDLFFIAVVDSNFLDESQREINAVLNEKNYDISFQSIRSIRSNLSEEVYNEFAEYLLRQSYSYGGGSVAFGDGATILDISRYISGDAYGGQYIQFLVIDGDRIYTARLENAMPPGADDWGIEQIMGYSNNVFKVTEVKPFALFGVD